MALESLIGKTTTIKIKNITAAFSGPFAHKTEPYVELTGVVQPLPIWEKDTDFAAIQVKDEDDPLRLVHLSLMVRVNGKPLVKVKRSVDKVWNVASSSTNEVYKVREQNGKWTCTCVANASFRKLCKHIRSIKG